VLVRRLESDVLRKPLAQTVNIMQLA